MKVVFAGTPGFAVPVLAALAGAHDVVLVVSQPDRPKGRGRGVESTEVHREADRLGLKLVQPERLKEASSAIAEGKADVIVTAAYGQKVPGSVLGLARHGGLNVHASLLPRHRGASPVASAILSGDAKSGVTIFRMVKEMDAGPVLLMEEIPIMEGDTAATLEAKLSALGSGAILRALEMLEKGAPFTEQDHAKATLAPKLTRDDGRIDWSRPAEEIVRRIHAMNPWPGAAAAMVKPDGSRVRVTIHEARVHPGATGAPGTVASVDKTSLHVHAGSGAVSLLRLQPESKKPLSAAEFINGFRLRETPVRFEAP